MSAAIWFRVHFTDGTSIDVQAATAAAARDDARDRKGGGIVSKIKVRKKQPA